MLKSNIKTVLLSALMVAMAGSVSAEGVFKPKSMQLMPFDTSAATYSRSDYNDVPCALVKLVLLMPDIGFEGNLIGDAEYNKGEYWLYLSNGTKQVKIKHANYAPMLVEFKDFGIPAVESKKTYELMMEVHNDDPAEEAKLRQYADEIARLRDEVERSGETDDHKFQRALETKNIKLMASLASGGYEKAYLQAAELYSDAGDLDNAEIWAKKAIGVGADTMFAKFLLRHISEKREKIKKKENSDSNRKQKIIKKLFD